MFRRLISIAGGVFLGLAASQFPEFAQQYQQRLGGAVDELRAFVEKFDASAASVGLTRKQALDTYIAADNTFLTRQGEDAAATLDRFERLETQLAALENANIFTRVTDFALYYDPAVAEGALDAYSPAVPVTSEGFIYAGIGVVLGYFAFAFSGWASARLFRNRWHRVSRIETED